VTGHARGDRLYRRLLIALFFAGTATFAQLYAPQVALPQIAEWFETTEAGAGLLISSATIGLALGVVPWGIAAQRFGTVRVMSVAISGAALVGLVVPFLPSYDVVLAGRFVEGVLLAGVPAVAIAYIAQEVTAADVTRATAALFSGNGLGGMLGRFISGPLAEFTDWRAGVLVVAVLCAGCAVAFVLTIPPSARRVEPERVRPVRAYAQAVKVNLARSEQRMLYALGFLLMGVSVALYNYLGFALQQEPYNLGTFASTFVFLAYVSGMIAAPRAGSLTTRFGRRSVLLVATGLILMGLALTAVPSLPVLIVGLLIATAGFFSSHSIAASWAAASAPGGTLQASGAYSLSYYTGSSVVGWAAGTFLPLGGWPATVAFLAALTLLALVVAGLGLRHAPGGHAVR
jgi:YNFM family putative membrane transporter